MNSSLNNQNRRQSFILKILDLNTDIDKEEFNKLLGEASTVGILVKIQEDKKNHLSPAAIYNSFIERFGENAYVIKNFDNDINQPIYYKLRDTFLHTHYFNIGKDAFCRLKELRQQIVRKNEQREAREKRLMEIQKIRDSLLVKLETQKLTENDLLQAINCLEKYGIIRRLPEDSEKYDLLWKHLISQSEGRPVLKIKKYSYSGSKDKGSIEWIFFNEVKYQFRPEILRQIHQKRNEKQLNNKPAYSDHSAGGYRSRKIAKLMIHFIKGESRHEKKRRKKIEKQARKRRDWQYLKENYYFDDE